MLRKLRQRITYANVMATLAVFIALGGTSYAALRVSSQNIVDNSVRGVDVRDGTLTDHDTKRNGLTGKSINESSLGRVPRARDADLVGGVSASSLKIRCPDDTFPIADVCVERAPRAATSYGSAVLQCLQVGTPAGPGRRLPTHGELLAALTAVTLAPGGELTSNVYPSSSDAGRLDVIYVTDQVGGVALTPDTAAGAKPFRCVSDPLN